MKFLATMIASILLVVSFTILSFADESLRRSGILNGNKITTEFWDYGSFSAPGNRVTDFVWNGLGYAYEINFFIGAEVDVPQNSHPDVIHLTENGQDRWVAHVISDGLRSAGGEFSPDLAVRWGWEPMATADYWFNDFLNLNSDQISQYPGKDLNMDSQPDSWPDTWWRSDLSAYAWPGLWGWNDIKGAQEAVYAMDDRDNAEFRYYPFPADTNRRGLGVQVAAHAFQLGGAYEDALFVTFDLKNVSEKDLDKMVFGVWGDPHIGGSGDYQDDWQSYDPARNMIYAWDDDGKSLTDPDITPGYFGISFIQTPGNATDGIDNDGDGLTDESQSDGIDNDNDWDAARDDLGEDGIAGTGDAGEGDGLPTPGEPNFEFKDMDEADMPGLNSMGIKLFSALQFSDDEKIWQALTPGEFDTIAIPGDYVLLGGSGYFSLKKGESKRVGIIFALGSDKENLDVNVDYASIFYHDNLGSQSPQIPITITSPQENATLGDQVEIHWDSSLLPVDAKLSLSYSRDNGSHWYPAVYDIANSGSYTWDVSTMVNSAFYKIRLRSISPKANALGKSDGYFTIDRSGESNVPPEVFLNLSSNSVLSGEVAINWLSGDADGDTLSLQLLISSQVLRDTILLSGNTFTLNSADYPNGTYELAVSAFDGQTRTSKSVTVTFSNEFSAVSDGLIIHRSGNATGQLNAHIFDENKLKARRYFISINDSMPDVTHYSVHDSASGLCLVDNDPLPISPNFGRVFDGLCVSFVDDAFGLDEENSGWSAASQSDMEFGFYSKKYDPYDYDIIFYDHVVDTSVNNGYMPFRVLDIINNTYMKTAVQASSLWTAGKTFYILRGGESPADIVWEVSTFIAEKQPTTGDVFQLRTHKSFSAGDTLVINAVPLDIESSAANIPQSLQLFQNYPNPFNNSTTIGFYLPQREHVTLEIFTILGQKVASVAENDFNAGEYRVIWNGLNEHGQTVSSGVYIYRLITPSQVVSKKLILIK